MTLSLFMEQQWTHSTEVKFNSIIGRESEIQESGMRVHDSDGSVSYCFWCCLLLLISERYVMLYFADMRRAFK